MAVSSMDKLQILREPQSPVCTDSDTWGGWYLVGGRRLNYSRKGKCLHPLAESTRSASSPEGEREARNC